MRILVAPDKFKGSLTASQVAAHVAAGLEAADPGVSAVAIPVADGGEGTLDAAEAAGFRRVPVDVTGPTGETLVADLAVRGTTAVVEMAVASGLAVLRCGKPAPLTATSLGTGQLIRSALDLGCTEVVIGVGGSACTDGGAGMLVGLGARLLDATGRDLPSGGGALPDLARVDVSGLDPRLASARVVLASDVDNPLLGPRGAAAVYGPQKGASSREVELLETGLRRWVDALGQAVEGAAAAAASPGAGAAGGVGYACLAALGAERRPGIDVVLDLTEFPAELTRAGLVVTGEGSLDEQTLHGKAPVGVAARARAAGVPVVAVAGRCLLSPVALRDAGIHRAYALVDVEPDVARCLRHAGPLLEQLARRIASEHLAVPTAPAAGASAKGHP